MEMRRRRTPRGLLNFDYSCLQTGVPQGGMKREGRGVYTEAGCILVGGTVVMPSSSANTIAIALEL